MTHRGKCWVKVTVSTSTVKVWPATNSATSRSAIRNGLLGFLLKIETNNKKTQLESLGSVVVNGCPPLASRICRRVSLNSRPGTEVVTVAGAPEGAEVPAVLAGGATPSRSAFSCAAFSARSRLSTSICALIAARAFFSSSFSK